MASTFALDSVPASSRADDPAPSTATTWKNQVWEAAATVGEIAKKVFGFLLLTGTFLANPGIFVVGFTAGVLFPDQMAAQVEKIQNFWNGLTTFETVMVGIGTFLAWPIVSATASLFVGSFAACYLRKSEPASDAI